MGHPAQQSILIVEDDEDDIHFLTSGLIRVGIPEKSIFSVNTSVEANAYIAGIGAFQAREVYPLPSVMFIDPNLADGNSMESISAWRSELGRGTLMVVVTGSLKANQLHDAYKAGADSFLLKPVIDGDLQNLCTFYSSFFENIAKAV